MITKPILGISMGDPAGVGPEISVKALSKPEMYAQCRPFLVGDAGIMKSACAMAGHPEISVNPVSSVKDCLFQCGTIDVYDLTLIDTARFKIGQLSAMGGEAAFAAVKKLIELALAGEVDATVTNPINKEAIHLAGHHYSGHTEIYADFCGTKKYSMMLAEGDLRVVHVSTHVALRDACDLVKRERVLEVIRLANDACKKLGIPKPRIAVAGLNPHAGENGLFGREELDEIIPAIEDARRDGLVVDGPVPPDTVFSRANGGIYDIVVAMYHDQGHIPMKVLGFQYDREKQSWKSVDGVNITLGLPIIRSSVDHGTAFDVAGRGIASEASLVSAIKYGIMLARNK